MKVLLTTLAHCAAYSIAAALPQDVDTILSKGDELLEEAKKAYDKAKAEDSVEGFIHAGFKLEEARIKFLVVQEIGQGEKTKAAADRLRAAQQLAKLINDGKVAVMKARPAPETPDAPPVAPPPPEKAVPAPARAGADLVKKVPVPEAAAVKEADSIIRDLFKEDYAKKGTADCRALARKLLEQASRTTDDPPGLYALYQAAIDAAAQGCDPETSTYAVDQMARFFDVDRLALRTDALAGAAKAAKTTEEWTELAEAHLKLADDLVLDDSFDGADKAATAALQHARKAKNVPLVTKVTARGKEISEAKTRFRAMKGSLEILAKTPDHPGANLEMGEFLCYVKGNWDLGLRFLAKGSNPALKALAEREIAAAAQARELFGLAGEWEKLAEKERSSLRKAQMESHVRELYLLALRGAAGLLRAQIEKKLSDKGIAVAAMPTPAVPSPAPKVGLGAPGVDLLALIDLKRDTVSGSWTMEGSSLLSPDGPTARVQVPYCPPEEYDVVVTLEKRSGAGTFNMGLVAGGAQFTVVIDGFGGGIAAAALIDGKIGAQNETTTKHKVFVDGKPKTVVFKIRKSNLTVQAENKVLIDWRADYSRCSLNAGLRVPSKDALFLMSHTTQFAFHSARLVPVSGQGRLLHSAAPSTFNPAGRWIKHETGTEFVFTSDGTVSAPSVSNKKYHGGKWVVAGDTMTLTFEDQRIVVTIVDDNTLAGTWSFKRKE